MSAGSFASGVGVFTNAAWRGWRISPVPAAGRSFPPAVALHLVRLACELPGVEGRSLSHWTCSELARKLVEDGIVPSISPQTVHRILSHHRLKPWRVHYWMNPKAPRDAEFYATVQELCELYTRPLGPHEVILSVDEKTSIQPRQRISPTRPAQPGRPVQIEHEYERAGALHLFAAFDIRSGKVYGQCHPRKRQVEFIQLLEHLDAVLPAEITLIRLIADNISIHKGKEVCQWLQRHPRFHMHFTPVHCSWMNQVEQWFSILQRKRLCYSDFAGTEDLRGAILQFIEEWNRYAHPFRWTRKSFEKILSKMKEDAARAA